MQSHISILYIRSGQVVRWYWANFQCRGVLLVWINVGQGHTALAIDSGGGCFDACFSHLSALTSFSLSLGDDPILTEILSQRAVKANDRPICIILLADID